MGDLTAVEKQIRNIKAQLRKDAVVKLDTMIAYNEKAMETLTREEIINEVHDYIVEQFFRRCANRGITTLTFRDDQLEEIFQEYWTKEPDHVPGITVNGGKL